MPRKCHRPTFGKTVKPFMGLFGKFGVVIPTELCQAPGICFCFLQRTYVFTGIVTSRCGMTDDRNLWIHTLALHLLFKITFLFLLFLNIITVYQPVFTSDQAFQCYTALLFLKFMASF